MTNRLLRNSRGSQVPQRPAGRVKVVLSGVVCLFLCAALAAISANASEPGRSSKGIPALENLSPFVQNAGQCGPEVLYYADAPWGRLYVRTSDLVLQLIERASSGSDTARASNVYLRFDGMPIGSVKAEEQEAAVLNVMKGRDPQAWQREIPTFGKIRLEGIAPGLDVVLASGSQNRGGWWTEGAAAGEAPLKLLMETGLAYRWDDQRLLLETSRGEVALAPPGAAISATGGTREDPPPRTSRLETQQLLWGTYLGGTSGDDGMAVAVDAAGTIVVAGHTESTDIPTPNGFDQTFNLQTDIYVAKLSANGAQLLWGTYLGGSSWDYGWALAIDADGNPIVGGGTYSSDIPTPGGYRQTRVGKAMYVAKLSSSGSSLLWGTFVDGSVHEECHSLVLDGAGNVVVAGPTSSSDLPVPGGYDTTFNGGPTDLYVGKLSADGASLLWGTYIGGAGQEGLMADRGVSLALDASGDVLVGSSTNSSAMPTPGGYSQTFHGLWDMWVGKLSPNGSQLLWGTYLGGANDDQVFALAADASGNAVVGGASRSTDIPTPGGYDTSQNGGWDHYLAKISSTGSQLLWGTFVGGSGDDYCRALTLDGAGNVVFGGSTRSDDMPAPGGYDTSRNGFEDLYLGVLSSSGTQLLSGTFLGGTSSDFCWGIALDGAGGVVAAGYTSSTNIPVPGGYTTTHVGGHDFYVAKLSDSAIGVCRLSCSATVPAKAAPSTSVSFQSTVTIDPSGCTTPTFDWDFGDSSTHSSQQNTSRTYTAEGTYTWKLMVSGTGSSACSKSGSITITTNPCDITCDAAVPASAVVNTAVAFAGTAAATGCSSAPAYAWTFGDGATSTLLSPTHAYTKVGTFGWTFAATSGAIRCEKSGTITVSAGGNACLVVGSLKICADTMTQSGSTQTFSGNVRINDLLWFTGDVTYVPSGSTLGNLSTSGGLFVKDIGGTNATLVQGTGLAYLVDGSDGSLLPTAGPDLYGVTIAGIPLQIAATPIKIDYAGVTIMPYADLGADPIILAKVQIGILFAPGTGKQLVDVTVIAGNITPSISIASVSVTYDSVNDLLTGSVSAALPFLGMPSCSCTIRILAGCFNGFDITVGLPAGIPLGQSGLEITGFTLNVDNICQYASFHIFVGGDLGIVGVPSEVVALQQMGLGYQVPFTLEIEGGNTTFLGFPISSVSGQITVWPPAVSVEGNQNLAGVYTTHIAMSLDVGALLISGSASGSFQIPDWSCCWNCWTCKVIRGTLRRTVGLPKVFLGVDSNISLGKIPPNYNWGGDVRGMVTAAGLSMAVALRYESGSLHVLVGTNFNNLMQIFERQTNILGPLAVEKSITLPSEQPVVLFGVGSAAGTLPSIYLTDPQGQKITPANASSFPGVQYIEDAAAAVALFQVQPAAPGRWTLGTDNLSDGDAGFTAMAPQAPPGLTWDIPSRSERTVALSAHVSPTTDATTVSFFYSRTASGQTGTVIAKDVPAKTGIAQATWNTAGMLDGTYYIFAKADDAMNPPTVLYYEQPVVVNNSGLAPPSGLTGTRAGDTASLSWTPSAAPDVAGYDVLYTDEPLVAGTKFTVHSAVASQATVTGLNPAKEYRFCVAAYDREGRFSVESNSVTLKNVPPPVVSTMTKAGNPFRIMVSGSNLQSGIKVFINGSEWTNKKWMSTGQMKLKGGAALKAAVPKGTAATFRFLNPDAGEMTMAWQW